MFSSSLILLLGVVLISLSPMIMVNGEDEKVESWVRFTCKNGRFAPTSEVNVELGKCQNKTDEYGEGKKDPKCIAFCFTEAIKGLNKDGLPDKPAFDSLIESEFPEKSRKLAKEQMDFCFEQHGSKVDLKDDKCTEMAGFSACATSLVKAIKC